MYTSYIYQVNIVQSARLFLLGAELLKRACLRPKCNPKIRKLMEMEK